jgi:hypothetical protein
MLLGMRYAPYLLRFGVLALAIDWPELLTLCNAGLGFWTLCSPLSQIFNFTRTNCRSHKQCQTVGTISSMVSPRV